MFYNYQFFNYLLLPNNALALKNRAVKNINDCNRELLNKWDSIYCAHDNMLFFRV